MWVSWDGVLSLVNPMGNGRFHMRYPHGTSVPVWNSMLQMGNDLPIESNSCDPEVHGIFGLGFRGIKNEYGAEDNNNNNNNCIQIFEYSQITWITSDAFPRHSDRLMHWNQVTLQGILTDLSVLFNDVTWVKHVGVGRPTWSCSHMY